MIPLVSLHHKLHYAAWYVSPSYFQSVKTCFENLDCQSDMEKGMAEFFSFYVNQRPPVQIDSAGIAVITVSGILGNSLSPLEKLLGFTDYQDLADECRQCIDEGARAVLFEMDCPGGEAQGALETAQIIATLDVPKASYSSGLDTSAAYFLSSSVDRKFVSPSAISGSIGTILPWVDSAKFWDALGLAWEPITGAGESFKGAGMGPSLSDTERNYFQDQVNRMSSVFRDHVGQYRLLDYSKLQGAAFFGSEAIALNLADQIGSYDDAYQWLFRLIS